MAHFLSLSGIQARAAETPQIPKLFFEYSWLYDGVCSGETPVDSSWADEARDRTPEFQALWDRESPAVFQPIFDRFGYGLSRAELTATLSVCSKAPSMSHPLIINVSRFLKSYMGTRPPLGEDRFVDVVFHELLHSFVMEHLPRATPLLERYSGESKRARNHLHLMALQIYSYTQLGRTNALDWLEFSYSKLIGGDYARAWDIVRRIEGEEAFLAEFPTIR